MQLKFPEKGMIVVTAILLFTWVAIYTTGARNFLSDDGVFHAVSESSQSITATAPITVTPTPCAGACVIALTTPLTVPQGGTGNATAAAHSLPINEGTSAQANTGTGSTGQCLVSQGASADPTYKSGCWVLLNTLSADNTSSVLQDTTSLTGSYNEYILVFEELLPASAGGCELQVHSSSAYKNTGYVTSAVGNATAVASPGAGAFIPCSDFTVAVDSSGTGLSGRITVYNPSLNQISVWRGEFGYVNGTFRTTSTGGVWNTAGVIDGFQVQFAGTPNITSGTIKVYGVP